MGPAIAPLPAADNPLGSGCPCAAFTCDSLKVYVYRDRRTMGRAAAVALAGKMRELADRRGSVNCVFAAAPSQDDVLGCLVERDEAPWDRVACVLHMDEYVGLSAEDPRSFRHYLDAHLFAPLRSKGRPLEPGAVHLIRGEAGDPSAEARRYASLVRAHPPDVVQGGIGEGNAHIAFNDPPEARFDDPELVKVIALAPEAKRQQVAEGHYRTVADVPPAITLTVPALTRFAEHVVGYWSCVVPTERKASAVARLLLGEVTEEVPATALRMLPDAALFLDAAAAGGLRGRLPGVDLGCLD